jgi:hypothetical protein
VRAHQPRNVVARHGERQRLAVVVLQDLDELLEAAALVLVDEARGILRPEGIELVRRILPRELARRELRRVFVVRAARGVMSDTDRHCTC